MIDAHDLISKWAAGGSLGRESFARLHAKYDKKIQRDAKRLGCVPEDTSQDVWLRLTEALHNGSIPDYGTLEEYLYRLTQKARARDGLSVGQPQSMMDVDAIPTADLPSAPGTEDILMAAQMTELVARVVDGMPPEVRGAWVYKRRGDTDQYAASQLEISERTYRNRVTTARAIIKEALEKHCY